jgi:ribonuclease-3
MRALMGKLRGWWRRKPFPEPPPGLRLSPRPEVDPDDNVARFCGAIGTPCRDPQTFRQALTHRSYLAENGQSRGESNERMEFLGDSVLELVVNEYLYGRYVSSREGDLTKKRSLLVSRAILARKARELGLGAYLFLSDAEDDAGGRRRDSILADGYEAVVGAIYLDQGIEAARGFIHRTLLADAPGILSDQAHLNFKSLLQEHVQSSSRSQPRYRVCSESGPDHEKTFVVEVVVRGTVLGEGSGRNKKEAEQVAAKDALMRLEMLGDTSAEPTLAEEPPEPTGGTPDQGCTTVVPDDEQGANQDDR